MRVKKSLATAMAASAILASGLLFLAPQAAGAAPLPSTAASATPTTCTWQYVVTDGIFNDVLIYSGLGSRTVIGRIHPDGFFTATYLVQPATGNQGVRLPIIAPRSGWVNYGNWLVPRY